MSMLSDESNYDNYTETSDSEDQDTESTYGGNAQSILSSLDESIGKIDDFLAYERGFVHGDVVCSITDQSGQLGQVMNVDMIVDLETRFDESIKDVNSKKLQKVRSIASGDYVVHGPWLGRVVKVHDAVTILFNDGARCEIMTGDSENLIPISAGLFDDAPYPYYLGQRVRIKLHNISKSVRWLCGSWNSVQNKGTICNVEVGLVHVNWIASVPMSCGSILPPSRLQNPKNLTLLSCFPYANWQPGDWCILPSENYSSPSHVSHGISKMQKLGMDDRHSKQTYVITKKRSRVDVLWQNGSSSVGLDSQTLFPVNSVGEHDFWPGQFVLEKVTSEDLDASGGARVGIVKNVDAQDRTVKVKWKIFEGEVIEEVVSAYELMEHPDFSYCIGDVVFRASQHRTIFEDPPQAIRMELNQGHDLSSREVVNFLKGNEHDNMGNAEDSIAYLSYIGNVIGFRDEGVEVRWATGLTAKVHPSEIFGLDRFGDPPSISAVIKESVQENASMEMVEQERRFCLSEVKGVNNSTEADAKDIWGISSLFFPCAPVGLLKSIASSVLVSSFSTSMSCFWKGVPEFQIVKSEEEHLNENDIKRQSLKQQVKEGELNKNQTSSPGNEKSGLFKQFDVVDDYSDHHFVNNTGKGLTFQVRRFWLKKVQQEWAILKKDLPVLEADSSPDSYNNRVTMWSRVRVLEAVSCNKLQVLEADSSPDSYNNRVTMWSRVRVLEAVSCNKLQESIFVRVYEERIDLLRACIVGALGTPYHDGLFFFDILFPPEYPNEPPVVHYNSGGLRLNPNLYESGKVCLSLLNTWSGTGTEVWNTQNSTLLQVLLSLQALVLNDKPYFNEAGYDKQLGRAEGKKNCITYNENAFLLSCKSMLYVLRKPPKHFEELVHEHFTRRLHNILLACQVYMDGAPVGCPLESRNTTGGDVPDSCSAGFKIMLAKLFPKLVSGFVESGIDCSQFHK